MASVEVIEPGSGPKVRPGGQVQLTWKATKQSDGSVVEEKDISETLTVGFSQHNWINLIVGQQQGSTVKIQ